MVDDDPDIVVYLSLLLEDHGYEVQSSSDSRAALAKLETFHPDAVIIDVLMPGRSGLDLLVALRRDDRWCDIPVALVTGNDKVLEDECQSYLGSHPDIRGPEGVLGKPIHPSAFLALVANLTGG